MLQRRIVIGVQTPYPNVVELGGRLVGAAHDPYVIAETSANYLGSKRAAPDLVRQAHAAGVDAVKPHHCTPEPIMLGMAAARDLEQGAPLSWPDLRRSNG